MLFHSGNIKNAFELLISTHELSLTNKNFEVLSLNYSIDPKFTPLTSSSFSTFLHDIVKLMAVLNKKALFVKLLRKSFIFSPYVVELRRSTLGRFNQ